MSSDRNGKGNNNEKNVSDKEDTVDSVPLLTGAQSERKSEFKTFKLKFHFDNQFNVVQIYVVFMVLYNKCICRFAVFFCYLCESNRVPLTNFPYFHDVIYLIWCLCYDMIYE